MSITSLPGEREGKEVGRAAHHQGHFGALRSRWAPPCWPPKQTTHPLMQSAAPTRGHGNGESVDLARAGGSHWSGETPWPLGPCRGALATKMQEERGSSVPPGPQSPRRGASQDKPHPKAPSSNPTSQRETPRPRGVGPEHECSARGRPGPDHLASPPSLPRTGAGAAWEAAQRRGEAAPLRRRGVGSGPSKQLT